MDDAHQRAMVSEAVARNRGVGNYKYAADQLTLLIARSMAAGQMAATARLQEEIDACDRAGARNAALPETEDLDAFAAMLAAATSAEEADCILNPLVAGA